MQVQRTASAGPYLLPVPGAIQDLLQSLQHQVTILNYKISKRGRSSDWSSYANTDLWIVSTDLFTNLEKEKIAVSLQTGGFGSDIHTTAIKFKYWNCLSKLADFDNRSINLNMFLWRELCVVSLQIRHRPDSWRQWDIDLTVGDNQI